MEYDQVFRHIRLALALKDMSPPQPGLYRILVSSEARRHLDQQKHRNIVKHLSHSMQTSRTYHELMDTSEAYTSLNLLSMLRRWSREEIDLITMKWPLSLEEAPISKDCKEFIHESGITRSSREIAFKCSQLKQSQQI